MPAWKYVDLHTTINYRSERGRELIQGLHAGTGGYGSGQGYGGQQGYGQSSKGPYGGPAGGAAPSGGAYGELLTWQGIKTLVPLMSCMARID